MHIDRRVVEADARRDRREFGRDRRRSADDGTLDLDGRIDRAGRAGRPVVEAEAIAEQVEPGAASDIEQRERCRQPRRDGGERGTDHRGPAHFVGVHLLGREQLQHGVPVAETHVDEERSRIGIRRAGVDRGERVVDAAEHQVVDGGEEQERVVPAPRRLGHEVEDLVALGNGPADPVVEGRVPAARRVGDVQPDRGEITHGSLHSPRCERVQRVGSPPLQHDGGTMTIANESRVYYDPYDAGISADPFPTYRRLRDEAPIYYNERYDVWALSRHADVEKALVDWETFSNSRSDILEIIQSGFELPSGVVMFEDPPSHTMHRGLMSRVFTPRRMNELEDQVREYCRACLDPLVGTDRFDFVKDLGEQMPMRVIGMLLGIPESDQPAVRAQGRRDAAHRGRQADGGAAGRHRRRIDVRRLHRLAGASTRPTT